MTARRSAAGGAWMIGLCLASSAGRAESPALAAASAQNDYARGQALFSGTLALRGRIYTHVADMPPPVVRCANCHATANGPDVPRSLAPRLTHDLLLRPQTRRGGPPSNYDRERFCTVLRRGLDPAYVLISVEMPRYSIDDRSCRALWQYLTGSGHDDHGR